MKKKILFGMLFLGCAFNMFGMSDEERSVLLGKMDNIFKDIYQKAQGNYFKEPGQGARASAARKIFLIPLNNGQLTVWDLQNEKLLETLELEGPCIEKIEIKEEEEVFKLFHNDGSTSLWSLETYKNSEETPEIMAKLSQEELCEKISMRYRSDAKSLLYHKGRHSIFFAAGKAWIYEQPLSGGSEKMLLPWCNAKLTVLSPKNQALLQVFNFERPGIEKIEIEEEVFKLFYDDKSISRWSLPTDEKIEETPEIMAKLSQEKLLEKIPTGFRFAAHSPTYHKGRHSIFFVAGEMWIYEYSLSGDSEKMLWHHPCTLDIKDISLSRADENILEVSYKAKEKGTLIDIETGTERIA